MAAVRDLYAILGVGRDASSEDIRKAYRRLARELHPDVNGTPDAEERFKQVTGAYEILSDPQRRRQYDTFGAEGGPGGSPFGEVQDIFDFFFGAGGRGTTARRPTRRSRARRGEDLFVSIGLAFREAAFGLQRELEVHRLHVCDRCLGNGAQPGTAPSPCRACGGAGQVQEVRRSIFGQLMTSRPCEVCEGTGLEIVQPCEGCAGDGRVPRAERIPVEIPPGVADGMELRVPGGGHAGRAGGSDGDLYVALHVESDVVFERRGQDLHAVLEVSMVQAALGTEAEVETLDGIERVRIDPGTESGTALRLRGKGIPHLRRRGRGDLYLTVHVRMPTGLERDQRELLERLGELRGEASGKGSHTPGRLRHPEAG
jgi:molecular chaperone DnaJ